MLKNSEIGKKFSEKLGVLFAKLPIEPNSITILSVILALLGYVIYEPSLTGGIQSVILFILAFFFDALDGAIARAKNKMTKEGAFLDGITDRVVEFFLIMTLFKIFLFNGEMTSLLFVIMFFGTCMTSFVKAYAEHRGILEHDDAASLPGLFERTERGLLLLIVLLAAMFSTMLHVRILLYLTAALSLLTFLQRFYLVMYGKKQN